MNTTKDFLTERVNDSYAATIKKIAGQKYLNGIATFQCCEQCGEERAIPLDSDVFMSERFRSKYPDMIRDTATLVGMSPSGLLTTMSVANMNPLFSMFSAQAWPKFVMDRIRRIRPNYVVIVASCAMLEFEDPEIATPNDDLKIWAAAIGMIPVTKLVPHLFVLGMNPVRQYVRMAPLNMTEDGFKLGKDVVLDSLKEGDKIPSCFGDIYRPGNN